MYEIGGLVALGQNVEEGNVSLHVQEGAHHKESREIRGVRNVDLGQLTIRTCVICVEVERLAEVLRSPRCKCKKRLSSSLSRPFQSCTLLLQQCKLPST